MIVNGLEYDGVHVNVEADTFTFVKSKSQEERHFPASDENIVIDKGRLATRITCDIIVRGDEERILWESLLHGNQKAELVVKNMKYKQVKVGEESEFEPQDSKKDMWTASVEFVCLDPIPYDADTGHKLYH